MQVDVLNIKGEKSGRSIELPDEIFAIEPNDHVIYLAVKQHLAAQRQGTHKVKTRLEVKGSSKKLHRQKGTGGARKGNLRSPLNKGGGTIFGPKPRDYDIKLNRKVKDLAKMSALTYKAKENGIMIVEDINLETPKTKQLTQILGGLKINAKKLLFIYPEDNENLFLSVRNIPKVKGSLLADMSTYDIVNADVLVLTESTAKVFAEDEAAVEA
jgi:large subunit ribosomal protein L4